MQKLMQDIRFALRQLRKSPGFTITVVLTLALGVGANAIVFSVLNALVLRPLPLPDAKQLVFFNRLSTGGRTNDSTPSQSYPDYRDLRNANTTFTGIAAYNVQRAGVAIGSSIGPGDAVEQSWFSEVSENYFDVLAVDPALGRLLHPADVHGENSSPDVVLSYAYWHRRFNADPSAIGKTIEINKHPFTVIGVAPKTFTGTEMFMSPDFWVPIADQRELQGYSGLDERADHSTWVIGRLKPGVTNAQAEADLNAIAKRLARQYKDDDSLAFRLCKPGLIGETLGRPVQQFLSGVMVLAGLVLLAACANLGSLFAARAADRARELAVRISLGAGKVTLIRQLVTEAVVVSLIGGVVGLIAATSVLRSLSLWRPSPDFPIQVAVNADARVYAVALLLAIGSGLFFGLLPIRQIWNGHAYLLIKSGPSAVTGKSTWTLRDLLLVVQVILCSVLLTASLVAVRGLSRNLHGYYGFQAKGAMLADVDLQMAGYNDQQAIGVQHRAVDALSALPGVLAAGTINFTPLSLSTSDSAVYRDGTTDLRQSNSIAEASDYSISPGYLAAAQTKLLAGRDFNWHDDTNTPFVAIVNQTFARQVFSVRQSAEAIGRSFISVGKRWQVAGVVEDGKYVTLTEDPRPAMFFPSTQRPDTPTVFVVRSQADDPSTASAMRAALRSIDPGMPIRIESWSQTIGIALFPSVAATFALGVMGGLAAMLAVTGIFGMASYSVSKRVRELGLRVALGAQRKQLLSAALGRPARLLVIGSVAGVILGALTSRLLAHIVYQATSQDPVVLVGVVASMAMLALVATWLPARRALRIDPAALLREE